MDSKSYIIGFAHGMFMNDECHPAYHVQIQEADNYAAMLYRDGELVNVWWLGTPKHFLKVPRPQKVRIADYHSLPSPSLDADEYVAQDQIFVRVEGKMFDYETTCTCIRYVLDT